MNRVRICAAVLARLDALKNNPDLAGVYLHSVPASQKSNAPYAVIELSGVIGPEAQGVSMIEYQIDITIVALRSSPDTLLTIADQIYGDATEQVDGIPTTGLHRYDLPITLDSNIRSVRCVYQSESMIPTDDPENIVALTMTFALTVQQYRSP